VLPPCLKGGAQGVFLHIQLLTLLAPAGAKGKQLTTKPIARIASAKGSWWDDKEPPSKGVLD